jgi:Zn finger protein HypA/HybF involved in hydrogenase expression
LLTITVVRIILKKNSGGEFNMKKEDANNQCEKCGEEKEPVSWICEDCKA